MRATRCAVRGRGALSAMRLESFDLRQVRPSARKRKRSQLASASQTDVRQLVTRTQKRNEPMQTLNRPLGYVDHARVLIYAGPLPPSP